MPETRRPLKTGPKGLETHPSRASTLGPHQGSSQRRRPPDDLGGTLLAAGTDQRVRADGPPAANRTTPGRVSHDHVSQLPLLPSLNASHPGRRSRQRKARVHLLCAPPRHGRRHAQELPSEPEVSEKLTAGSSHKLQGPSCGVGPRVPRKGSFPLSRSEQNSGTAGFALGRETAKLSLKGQGSALLATEDVSLTTRVHQCPPAEPEGTHHWARDPSPWKAPRISKPERCPGSPCRPPCTPTPASPRVTGPPDASRGFGTTGLGVLSKEAGPGPRRPHGPCRQPFPNDAKKLNGAAAALTPGAHPPRAGSTRPPAAAPPTAALRKATCTLDPAPRGPFITARCCHM